MKKLDGDKVFINKGMVVALREQMGLRIQNTIVPTDVWISMLSFEDGHDDIQFFYCDSERNFDLIEVFDENAKQFIREADFILDYDYYNSIPLNELMKIHDDIAMKYNINALHLNNQIDACESAEEAKKVYEESKPEMDALDLQVRELYDLVLYRQKFEKVENIEEKTNDNTPAVQEEIVVKKRTLKDIIRSAWNKKNNK